MKVLFFDHSQVYGGAEKSLLAFLPLLIEPVEPILLLAENSRIVPEAAKLKIKCRTISIGPRLANITQSKALFQALDPRFWMELAKAQAEFSEICRIENPDILYANTFKAAVFIGFYKNKQKRQLFWHIRDIFAGIGGILLWCLGLLTHPKIIAVSRAASVQPFLSWPGCRPQVVYNGIDHLQWRQESEETSGLDTKAKLKVAPGEILIACFGQLTPWKGQEHAITALAVLIKKGILCKLLLVGDAVFADKSYPQKLRVLSSRLGVSGSVVFSGWMDNPAPYMTVADIVVHMPVKPEPFGRVLVEAMSLGKPVVAVRSGAIPEIIEDGKTGILCTPGELPFILEKLIYDPGKAKVMGEKARQRAERHFGIAETAKGIQKILTEI
ncbi:glycosyltransferase family 4 protein [candidate division TA06 bacterium]|nr:glycosyltransferase family 4 protein [candidate division TA06 bacterium]